MFREALMLALRALNGYRFRAFLTMLGITVGIFAISLTFLLVDSMKYSVTENLNKLGNNVIFVHKWPWKDNSEDWYKYFKRPNIEYSDFVVLKNGLKNADAVCFEPQKRGVTVRARGLDVQEVNLRGVTADFALLGLAEMAEGRFFSEIEVESGRKVCLLGSNLSRNLFGPGNPVGQQVQVAGTRLQVVGLLATQGSSIFGDSPDDRLVMPHPTLAALFGERGFNDRTIIVRARSPELVPRVEQDIVALMRKARGLRPGVEDDFSINKQETLMASIGQIFDVLQLGGFFISIFALVVGGFGIANIMFVAVKERTREIGLQKAMGATRRFILSQFLLESVILCLLGALLGLVLVLGLGALAQLVVNSLGLGFTVVMEASSIALGMLLSALVGLVAGFTPALFASRLDPVEAIRQG